MTDLPPDVTVNPKSYFPEVFVDMIAQAIREFLPTYPVVTRPLSSEDPSGAVGVFADNWTQDENSAVIGQFEPQDQRYVIRVQNMIKSLDHSTGRAQHSVDAKTIRVILYRDPDLRVRLLSVTEEMLSSIERVSRFGVARQEFLSGRVGSTFMFMTTTFAFVDTNTTYQN